MRVEERTRLSEASYTPQVFHGRCAGCHAQSQEVARGLSRRGPPPPSEHKDQQDNDSRDAYDSGNVGQR